MRLTSEIWVSAFVRRVFGDGGYAAIVRRGDAAAGAIFIQILLRDGTKVLYAPAPQALASGETGYGGRWFVERLRTQDTDAFDKAMASELRFDTDLWLVECEGLAKAPDDYFTIARETP